MKTAVLGKYMPLNSPIHNLDPRAKIIAMFLLIVAVFVPQNYFVTLGLFAIILICVIISQIGFKYILQAFKPLIFMMFFLLVINILTVKNGTLLASIGPLSIYTGALSSTLAVVTRLVMMIMLTTLLTATTKPLDLTLGIEYILGPLKIVKFPVHEVAMMISIALRFIPTIIEETMRIMNSQKSRGVDFEEGKLKEKISAILSLIVPLFAAAFQRAYDLADAMEARGYVPGANRTKYRKLAYRFSDFVVIFFSIAILGLSIASRFVL